MSATKVEITHDSFTRQLAEQKLKGRVHTLELRYSPDIGEGLKWLSSDKGDKWLKLQHLGLHSMTGVNDEAVECISKLLSPALQLQALTLRDCALAPRTNVGMLL